MSAASEMGIAAFHPSTGECFGAYRAPLMASEYGELMQEGAIIEAMPLNAIRIIFCEVCESRRVVERGPVVARFMDADIPSWIATADGLRYDFLSVLAGAQLTIDTGQLLLAPGLLFVPSVSA